MKYLTLLLSLICLLSCSQNKKKSEEQQYNGMMNLLKEKAIEQMQTRPDTTRYYWQQSPIIEALIKADTTDRRIHYKLKDAYEKSQKMSEAEQDSLIKKFNLCKDSTD